LFYVDARDRARRQAPDIAGSVPCPSAGLLRPGRRKEPRDDSNDCTNLSPDGDKLQSVEFDSAKHTLISGVVAGLVREIISPQIETTQKLSALHGITVSAKAPTMIDSFAWDHSKR
jgi:hypothetical protein